MIRQYFTDTTCDVKFPKRGSMQFNTPIPLSTPGAINTLCQHGMKEVINLPLLPFIPCQLWSLGDGLGLLG